jgi:hypothetical protein
MLSQELMDFGDVSFEDEVGTNGPTPPCGTLSTSPVFGTPLSQSVSQAGRELVRAPNESRVGLVLVFKTEDWCGGVIKGKRGGPVRWCTKGREMCNVVGHLSLKVDLEAKHYYIRCPKKEQARLKPALNLLAFSIPEADEHTLSTREETVEVWVTYFNTVLEKEDARSLVNAAARLNRERAVLYGAELDEDVPSPSTWTHVEAPEVSLFRPDVSQMKTPGRLNYKRPPPGNLSPTMLGRGGELAVLEALFPAPDEISKARNEMLPLWAQTMADNWSKIQGNFKLLSDCVENLKSSSDHNFSAVEQEFGSVARKVGVLDTRIGVNSSGEAIVSVWEAIDSWSQEGQRLVDMIDALKDRTKALETRSVDDATSRLDDKLDIDAAGQLSYQHGSYQGPACCC